MQTRLLGSFGECITLRNYVRSLVVFKEVIEGLVDLHGKLALINGARKASLMA